MRYINYNGNIFNEQETLLPVTNRGFRYGDGFFESMAMFNRKIPLLDFHWSRATFTAEVLSAVLPKRLTFESLESMILDHASVNDEVSHARVGLQFIRQGDGLYLPENEELGYVITMEKLENTLFECGNGLRAGVRDDCYKPVSMTSDLKTSDALNNVLAAQFAKAEGWDEIIMLNHYSQVCEAIHSNVFICKNGKLITPDLDSGCVNGVMRTYLMAALEEEIEERPVLMDELMAADEILLTNAVRGIQWIKSLGARGYKNKRAMEITALLNKNLLSKH